MNLHEYQGKLLFAQYGLPVSKGIACSTPAEAAAAADQIGGNKWVVKAQVHAGGRGKAGYVQLVRSAREAVCHARRMFAEPMVSKQTGPQGVRVRKILLAKAVDIAKEYYLGVVVDRARRVPVMMASAEGGVEIEEVAARNPDAIKKAFDLRATGRFLIWFVPNGNSIPTAKMAHGLTSPC